MIELAPSNLQKWSWKDIIQTYASFGEVLQMLDGYQKRCNIPRPSIERDDEVNSWLMRFWSDVTRIEAQLAALDTEILRRNKLIGVI